MGSNLLNISDSRSKLINFDALRNGVERIMGQTCISIEWVNEGGGNQIYLLSLGDGSNLLARLSFPFPHTVRTGEAFSYQEAEDCRRIPYRLQSEVATIRYISENTNIPVNTVYAFDKDLDNAVGTPYTLQQLLPGGCLADRWQDMTTDQRNLIITALGKISGQLYSCTFEGYGSLNLQMSVDALVEPILSLHRHHFLSDCGPWPSSAPYAPIIALVHREYEWLCSADGQQLFYSWRAKMHPKEDINVTLPVFLHLAKSFIQFAAHLETLFPIHVQAFRPTLSHPDFHFSNILVSHDDPTVVTGVVDWEHAAVLPFWDAYEPPGKIMDMGDTLEKVSEWREEKRRLRSVYYDAVVAVCPDAAVLEDPIMRRNIKALRLFKKLSTSGACLYVSSEKVMASLLEMRDCITYPDNPGTHLIDRLILSFSEIV